MLQKVVQNAVRNSVESELWINTKNESMRGHFNVDSAEFVRNDLGLHKNGWFTNGFIADNERKYAKFVKWHLLIRGHWDSIWSICMVMDRRWDRISAEYVIGDLQSRVYWRDILRVIRIWKGQCLNAKNVERNSRCCQIWIDIWESNIEIADVSEPHIQINNGRPMNRKKVIPDHYRRFTRNFRLTSQWCFLWFFLK